MAKKNNLKFTRQILHDLQDAASHFNTAQKEIEIGKDIIDRAVTRELTTKRKTERGNNG